MNYESKIQWKEYPHHKPQCAGYYMAIQDNVVGCGFFSILSGGWVTFLNETEEGSNPEITHWAYFPDAVPAQFVKENANLTKDQYIALSNIFHKRFDKFSNGLQMRTASFPAVVEIVEEFSRYLLAKEAAPEREGVDPDKFMDEVRGM